jgi:hypothetical protein
MIEVYVDESGIHDGASFCVVGGYRGSQRQWRDLQSRWTADGCQTEFHAKDFFGRDPNGQRVPPYNGWTDAKAKAYLDCRLDAINRTNIFPVGAMIDVRWFRTLSENERRHLTGGQWRKGKWRVSGAPQKPYFLPFQDVVIQAVEAVKPPGWKAHFYFDENKQMSSFARELFAVIKRGSPPEFSSRMGEVNFASSHESAGLQAADLFAHAWYQYRLHGKTAKSDILTVMDALAQKGDELCYFGAQTMNKLLGKAPLTDGEIFTL